MKLFLSLLIILFLQSSLILCQSENNNYSIGNSINIKSKILNEDRRIFVSLPEDYNSTDKRYPVLFVLDSKTNFKHSFGTESYLSEAEMIPNHIVVGIEISNPIKDLNLNSIDDRESFSSFIKDEVIPLIDKNYRTQPFKILFGHSVSGTFALYVFLAHEELFNSYIVSSPYDTSEFRFLSNIAKESLSAKYNRAKYLLIMAGNDPYFNNSLQDFIKQINENAASNLLWYYTILDNENYYNSALITLYNGLQYTYGDYKVPTTMSANGNLDSLKNYFQQLSISYGFDLNIPQRLLTEFGFQVLNAGRLNDAIDIFKYEVGAFPDSPASYGYLGITLEENNSLQDAEENYNIAYNKSVLQNSSSISYYKDKLEKIKMKMNK